MTELGKKLIAAAEEGIAIARGEAPLDPKDYEIMCLKLRNEQLRHALRVARQWLPVQPIEPYGTAAEDCARVDNAMAEDGETP